MLKKKYIVIFLIKEHQSYTEIKRKRINPNSTEINFNNKSYPIMINLHSYSKGLKYYYFIDTTKKIKCQIFFNKTKKDSDVSLEIIDMIISKHIVKQLTSNLTDSAFRTNLMYVLFGLLLGGCIGWIAGGFF